MCKFPETFLVKILAFGYEIREIMSARTRVDENLSTNVISDKLAYYLDCRIDDIDSCVALVKSEPVLLIGRTSVLVRLPRKSHWPGKFKFQKIECVVAVRPQYDLVIDRATKKALKLDELDE